MWIILGFVTANQPNRYALVMYGAITHILASLLFVEVVLPGEGSVTCRPEDGKYYAALCVIFMLADLMVGLHIVNLIWNRNRRHIMQQPIQHPVPRLLVRRRRFPTANAANSSNNNGGTNGNPTDLEAGGVVSSSNSESSVIGIIPMVPTSNKKAYEAIFSDEQTKKLTNKPDLKNSVASVQAGQPNEAPGTAV